MILKHAYRVWFILSIYFVNISIPLHTAYLSTSVVAVAGSSEILAHLQQTTWHPILEEAVLKAVYVNLDIFLQSSVNALQISGFMLEVAGSETQKRNFKLHRSSHHPKILL